MYNNFLDDNTGLYPILPIEGKSKIAYFSRFLLNTIKAQTSIVGVPAEWDYDYLTDVLFCRGFVNILDVPKFGVIPQACTLSHINVFNRPSHFIVTNPLFSTIEGRIGVDGALVKLFPDYGGFGDTIAFYASRMALASEAADISVFNSKLPYVIIAKNKAAAISARQMMDDINKCKPYVIEDLKSGLDTEAIKLLQTGAKNNFIAIDLLQAQNDLLSQFKDTVGIFHQNTEKKANLLNAEVQNSQAQVSNQLKYVCDCVNRGFDEVYKMFGIKMTMRPNIEVNVDENLRS